MDVKAFFRALPGIIATIEGGITLSGKKSERVAQYLDFADKLATLIAGSFLVATAKGEMLPGVARVGEPMPLQRNPEEVQSEALETLKALQANPEVQRIVNSPDPQEGEPAQAFGLPDFGPTAFLPLAELGIKLLLRLGKELKQRKQRDDTGKKKGKREAAPAPVKAKPVKAAKKAAKSKSK